GGVGLIDDNVWLAGSMTLVAVGVAGNTAGSDNVFNGPVELDDNHVDLGGGAGSSTGRNQFIGNGMSFLSGAGIMARDKLAACAAERVADVRLRAVGIRRHVPGRREYDARYDRLLLGLGAHFAGAAVAPACTSPVIAQRCCPQTQGVGLPCPVIFRT
ncbi:MAG: hypothetical protein IPO18_09360, partial [bacterium]|nr:hypothetical protein [bacterium]